MPRSPSPPRHKKRSPKTKTVIKPMKKGDIIESLPSLNCKRENFEEEDQTLRLARTLYGDHVFYLNPKYIEKCGLKPGQNFYGLQGQDWNKCPLSERKKQLKKITFAGFAGDEFDDDEDKKRYRSNFESHDDIIIREYMSANRRDTNFRLAFCLDGGLNKELQGRYGSGSGCDSVFIFLYSTDGESDDDL